jgi:phosphatidylglycerol---prolipoprotein diacylglyceryl transferase
MIPYPQIDPVIFRLGPLEPRWYGLAYIIGFLYTHRCLKKNYQWLGLKKAEDAESLLVIMVVGLILGARMVYVVFYNWEATMVGPWWEPFAVWHGGLASHGGFLGVVLGSLYAARRYNVPWLRLTDVVAVSTPVGLGLGRIANFINGELWGRTTDLPWAMIFPHGGPDPRHPSQLYQAFFEGLVLFVLMRVLWKKKPPAGVASAVFLLAYGVVRIAMEFFREPDIQVGFVLGPFTMGQLLSVILLAVGGYVLWWSMRRARQEQSRN